MHELLPWEAPRPGMRSAAQQGLLRVPTQRPWVLRYILQLSLTVQLLPSSHGEPSGRARRRVHTPLLHRPVEHATPLLQVAPSGLRDVTQEPMPTSHADAWQSLGGVHTTGCTRHDESAWHKAGLQASMVATPLLASHSLPMVAAEHPTWRQWQWQRRRR